MAIFNTSPFNFSGIVARAQEALSKRTINPRTDGRPDAEPRKGLFRLMNQTVNKKQQRVFTFNASTMDRLAKTDPITWSIIRTIKSFVNQAEWDIVIDTEAKEIELDRWQEVVLSSMSPYALSDKVGEFKSEHLSPDIQSEVKSSIRKILLENGVYDFATQKKRVQWFFESITRRIRAEAESHRSTVKKIFERPSTRGIESNWRALQELIVHDLLVYDAGCIVKNYSASGKLAELYHIPGQNVRLYRNEDRTIPEPPEPAYVWEDGGIARAEFTFGELVYIMQNPQANGYGMSPIEVAAYIITASIYADEYNIDYFKNSNVPPGVLNLGKDVTEEQRLMFQQLWEQEVRGRGGLHKMMFMSGSEGTEFIPMKVHTNRDMQMMEYMKWTLAVKTACYGLSPQDIGFTDTFKYETSKNQKEISQARGVRNILHLLQSYYNDEIVKTEFQFDDVKFEWQDIDLTDEEKDSRVDAVDITNGVLTRNERRKKLGLKPIDGGDVATISGNATAVAGLELADPTNPANAAGGPGVAGIGPQNQLQPGEEGKKPGEEEDKDKKPGESKEEKPDEETQQGPNGPIRVGIADPSANLNLKVNRRKPVAKQYELVHNVVDELKNKGVSATIKIGFEDEKEAK